MHRSIIWIIWLISAVAVPAAANSFTYTTIDVPGATSTLVGGISNNGVVVGSYHDSAGNQHGFERLADGTLVYPIDDPKGVVPSISLSFTVLSAVNNAGTIVGYGGPFSNDPFLLNGGVFTRFGLIAGSFETMLSGINDQGDSVGSDEINFGQYQAFLEQGNAPLLFFDAPGSTSVQAIGINNLGDIVGIYYLGDFTNLPITIHGYVRHADGTFVPVNIPGATDSVVLSINDSGVIVAAANGFGFFYGMVGNLTEFSALGPNASLRQINNAGQFVGTYTTGLGFDQVNHGFIGSFSDVPEPASWLLLVAGLVALTASRLKRA